MAKKSRRKSPRLSESQLYRPGQRAVAGVAPSAVPKPTVGTSKIPTEQELQQEYRYVLTDLRKIAWLAVAMLVLLVVLAIVIV